MFSFVFGMVGTSLVHGEGTLSGCPIAFGSRQEPPRRPRPEPAIHPHFWAMDFVSSSFSPPFGLGLISPHTVVNHRENEKALKENCDLRNGNRSDFKKANELDREKYL